MKIIIIALFVFINTSCASNFQDSFSIHSNSVTTNHDLENLIEKKITAADIISNNKELTEKEIKELKDYFLSKNREKQSNKKSLQKEILKSIKSKNYGTLKNKEITALINASAKLNKKHFEDLVSDLKEDVSCLSPNLFFASASLLEKDFPNEDALKDSAVLFQKAADCSETDELTARANYRLAMLHLLKSDCSGATKYLNSVEKSKFKVFLSRAEFWKHQCATSNVQNNLILADNFFKRFPLSYHSILYYRKSDSELRDIIKNKIRTPVLLRTEKNENVNLLMSLIENNLRNNKDASKEYLSYFSDSILNDLEPEFLIYLGYIANISNDDLRAFQAFAKAFSKNPELKTKTTTKLYFPLRYLDQIKKHSKNEDLDYLLVLSLIRQESAFNEKAVSRVGATGLMQIMPKTARVIDRKLNRKILFDADKNIYAGTRYLANLLHKYNNNIVYTLAAYNAGHGNVDKWIQRYKTSDDLVFMDTIPFQETRDYVSAILRNYYWYQSLESDFTSQKTILGLNQEI